MGFFGFFNACCQRIDLCYLCATACSDTGYSVHCAEISVNLIETAGI